jgi:two-component system sensor histidine kinase CpxA
MSGLFWRVFVWYLGSTIALLLIGALILKLTDPEFNFASTGLARESIQSQAQEAAQTYLRGGSAALKASLAKGPRARFLFDSEGRELSGKPAPPRMDQLVTQVIKSGTLEYEFIDPEMYAGTLQRVEGRDYVFIKAVSRSRLTGRPLPVWARLALGLFTAFLICIVFARYVASPLERLRGVTQEFAAGNLQARVGDAKPFNRKDEFSGLARDFDNMASQIENLVLSQQRMLGDISHELRSPLTRLIIAAEIAGRKSGPEAAPYLTRIEQEAERMNVLIGEILRTAKTEQVKPGPRKLFDISNLVRDVAADADFEAAAGDRRVVVKDCDPGLVHGDRESMRSAVENVIRNAIRYSPSGSEITVNLARVEPAKARVTVRDRGPGVPEESLTHLFEPFYRVNDARDRDSGGAGLGLAISRQVIKAHGGNVSAANCADGGLQVTIDLPLKAPDGAARSGIRFRANS